MKTHAQELLALVFEGHNIRVITHPTHGHVYVTNDVADAVGISKVYDIVKNHVDPDQLTSISLEVRSANGTTQKREFSALTQSGVSALVLGSRKPAARKFSRWLTDEVIPQLIAYGTYIPGADTEERCRMLRLRWLDERSNQTQNSEELMQENNLMTCSAFLKLRAIPARDVLPFYRHLQMAAKTLAEQPTRCFLNGRMRNAWPVQVLNIAYMNHSPRLALEWTSSPMPFGTSDSTPEMSEEVASL